MDFFLIILAALIGIALIIGMAIYLRKKSGLNIKAVISASENPLRSSEALMTERIQDNIIIMPIEGLTAITQLEEKNLCEITDSTIIARISQTFPAVAETATRTGANNALKRLEVYKAILPSGETLAKSKDMEGAVRGFSLGAKKIKSQANLVKVDVSKTSIVANGVANVMNVSSLVVGQYYMSEISSKLETMTKSIEKISNFQDREFKSRILSLITLVGEISQFSTEIMENEEQRKRKLIVLENLKANNTELLVQVNISITDIIKKSPTPDYKDYQAKVYDLNILTEYQNALVVVLEEISKLTYLLGEGTISTEVSYTLWYKFLGQSIQTRDLLQQWHEKQVKALGIDLDKERITKAGFEAFISAIPGLIDPKYNYKDLKQEFVQRINFQAKPMQKSSDEVKQVFSKDIEIIIKDGKYYYLHE